MEIKTKTPLLFFDTETTGIIRDEQWNIISNWDLIQLAYRKIWEDNKKIDKNLFFNTDTPILISAMAIHWIYPKLLKEKSNNKYLQEEDKKILGEEFSKNILIAHNIDFDKDVLEKSWIQMWTKLIDTLKVAKTMVAEWLIFNEKQTKPEYMALQYLRYFFELYEINDDAWNAECTTAHDAFWDVVVLENVFYKLFEVIKNNFSYDDEKILDLMQEITKKEFALLETIRVWKYKWKTFEEISKVDKHYLEWMIKWNFTEDIKYTCKVWLGQVEDKKFFK